MSIAQNTNLGVITRLRASLIFPSNPSLNIPANALGEEGITIEPEGGGGELLGQMTGAVVSLSPYVRVRISFGVLRTLSIGTVWYERWLKNSAVGDINGTPVTSVAPTHNVQNAIISSVGRIAENGSSAELPIVLTGTMIVNSDMWSAV